MKQKLLLASILALIVAALITLLNYHMATSVLVRMSICGAVAAAWMSFMFVMAQYKRRTDIIDVAWGISFILITLVGFILQDGKRELFGIQTVTTLLVVMWGFRLSWHIGRRFLYSRSQDPRYTQLESKWKTHRSLRRFFSIFMTQALLAVVVAIPVIHINLGTDIVWSAWTVAGICVWLIGFIWESIADYQLSVWLKKQADKNRLMMTGLRHYSRHPSYFGEMGVWWGFAIIALGTPHGWVGLIGALTITYLLRYVSGVPLAEASARRKKEWDAYADRTNLLIPSLPRIHHR